MITNKSTLIFDLDQTLVDSIPHSYNMFRIPKKVVKNIPIFISDKYMIHLRPHTIDLFEYCHTNNINIGIWSSGAAEYVQKIVTALVETFECITDNICMVWSRSKSIRQGPYFDVMANSHIKWDNTKLKYNTLAYKDINYVFANTKLNKNSTILIDNLPLHLYQNNPNNILIIPPFCYRNINDSILSILLDQLKKQKTKLLKATNFNMNYLSPDNKFIYPTGYINKCINKRVAKPVTKRVDKPVTKRLSKPVAKPVAKRLSKPVT